MGPQCQEEFHTIRAPAFSTPLHIQQEGGVPIFGALNRTVTPVLGTCAQLGALLHVLLLLWGEVWSPICFFSYHLKSYIIVGQSDHLCY
jgi:hypothetical protein